MHNMDPLIIKQYVDGLWMDNRIYCSMTNLNLSKKDGYCQDRISLLNLNHLKMQTKLSQKKSVFFHFFFLLQIEIVLFADGMSLKNINQLQQP